jgi:steroid delta-isomerase-like uncharacterized protein
MSEELIAQAREQIEAYNAGDWDRLQAVLTPDSVYRELGTGRTMNGSDEIVAAYQGWKQALPDSIGTVSDAFACGDRVAFQITWEGTQSGALPLPGGGAIEPTGRPINVPAIQILRMADGKVGECIHAFDMLTLLEQLGTVSADALASGG